jgi:toxin ParE1/3/4
MSMARHSLSLDARSDIQAILAWTQQRFGMQGRLRYEALLKRAIWDIADDPERHGSRTCPEITAKARVYHINNSRDRVEAGIGKVAHPRHFLLYRCLEDGRIEIGRILHESMDLVQHLPTEYQSDIVGEE